MPSRFLQIHTLTSYPAALLNRDDQGFAKRLPFGSATRTRVSSQCLKRHWRVFEGDHALGSIDFPPTFRSRQTFEREVVLPLVAMGLDESLVRAVTEAVMDQLGMGPDKKKKPQLYTGQVTVLGRPEIDYLGQVVREIVETNPSADKADAAVKSWLGKDGAKNLKRLGEQAGKGLSAALFGRMVTSDHLARTDAAIHVAHAFTVHEEQNEADYFSAIDDLMKDDGELGSGHIGNVDLTSGLYYGYVVVDLPLLVSNLTGVEASQWEKADRGIAAAVVERLIWLITTVSPGAKLGSTAPYAHAAALLVEAGSTQPRTLANAFLTPVPLRRGDVLECSVERLADHVGRLDRMYGDSAERRFASIVEPTFEALGRSSTVPDIARFAASVAGGGS